MTKEFIKQLLDKINQYYQCYYEEAHSTAKFPYLVIPNITITPLNAGYMCMFDIEIYINESTNVFLEDIIDNLKSKLDGYSFSNERIAFHLGFENAVILKSTEQDLSARRITFSARIFGKEN